MFADSAREADGECKGSSPTVAEATPVTGSCVRMSDAKLNVRGTTEGEGWKETAVDTQGGTGRRGCGEGNGKSGGEAETYGGSEETAVEECRGSSPTVAGATPVARSCMRMSGAKLDVGGTKEGEHRKERVGGKEGREMFKPGGRRGRVVGGEAVARRDDEEEPNDNAIGAVTVGETMSIQDSASETSPGAKAARLRRPARNSSLVGNSAL